MVIGGIKQRDSADRSWLCLAFSAEFGKAESIGAREGHIEIRLFKLIEVNHGVGELGDVYHDMTVLTEFEGEVVHA